MQLLLYAPGTAHQRRAPKLNLRAEAAFQRGRAALHNGQSAQASSYFREALQSHPRSAPILAALVQASGDHDADWPLLLHRLAAAAANETGTFDLGRTTRKHLG